jgi:hypothetical protein
MMGRRCLTIFTLPGRLAVCRLDPGDEAPAWAASGPLFSVTRTGEELSVVCSETVVPDGVKCEKGWRCLRIRGPLAFSEVDVLSSVIAPLARAGIPVFVVSTYDTDNILVQEERLRAAQAILAAEGHAVGP